MVGTASKTLDGVPRAGLGQRRGVRLSVRRAYCKGCNLCIPVCAPGILRLAGDDRIEVSDPNACLFCGACAARCPDFVFVVEREAV
jgi:2-oxoglutarate ferredoxin oxidoreductase subunit delta